MQEWVVGLAAAISAVGVIGQWLVGSKANAKRDGAVDEKLKSYGYRILGAENDIKDIGGRVSTIEGRLGAPGPHHGR